MSSPECNIVSTSVSSDASKLNELAQRDVRYDFIRGVALCVVLVDHIEDQLGVYVVRNWTLGAFGFSDAADVFVFLSGYVFGIAHEKRLVRNGIVSSQMRALWRSFQIYLVYQVTVWIVLAAGVLTVDLCPTIAHSLEMSLGLRECFVEALKLRFQPYPLAILACYIQILPFMPALFWLLKHARPLAWSLSLAIYLSSQVIPGMYLSVFPSGREGDFNPFAWQFLFFMGMACTSAGVPRNLLGRILTTVAVLVATWGLIEVKFGVRLHERLFSVPQLMKELGHSGWPWVGKPRLEPLRIVHFASVIYLGLIAFRRVRSFWTTRFARLIVLLGQYSLEAYAFGVVLTILCNGFSCLLGFPSMPVTLLIDFDACVLSIIFTYSLSRLKRARNRTSAQS